MKSAFYIIIAVLLTTTVICKGQSTETKNDHNMKKQILVDKFFIPKNAIEEFTQRMNDNRSIIKKLHGFIKDEAFGQTDNEGNMTIITVAIWADQESLNNAKNAVQIEYKKTGFNPVDFYQRLNIKLERGIYHDLNL